MNYKIKPEFLPLWGSDATEETIITDDDLEMIARGWEKDPEQLKDQLIPVDVVFEGYDPENRQCVVYLEDGHLFVKTADGTEPFNDEWYYPDTNFLFMLIHEGFRRC